MSAEIPEPLPDQEAILPSVEERSSVSFTDEAVEEFIEHGLGNEDYEERSLPGGSAADRFILLDYVQPPMIEETPLGSLQGIVTSAERNIMIWQIAPDGEQGDKQVLLTDSSFNIAEDGSYEGWWEVVQEGQRTLISTETGDFIDPDEAEEGYLFVHGGSEIGLKAVGRVNAAELVTAESLDTKDQKLEAAAAEERRIEAGVQRALANERAALLAEVQESKRQVEYERAEVERAEKRAAIRTPETIAMAVERTQEWLQHVRGGSRSAERHQDVLTENGLENADAASVSEALRINPDFRSQLREVFRAGIAALKVYEPTDESAFKREGSMSLEDVGRPLRTGDILPPERLTSTAGNKQDTMGIEGGRPTDFMAAEYAVRMLDGTWDHRKNLHDATVGYGELYGRTVYRPELDVHRAMATLELYGQIRAFNRQGEDVVPYRQ